MLNNIFFYIPGLYRSHTRGNSSIKIVPFLLTDFLPVFIFAYYLAGVKFGWWFICSFLLAYFSMFNLYEIGYIINDVITIKYEVNPTLRLKQQEIEYAKSKMLLIISARLLIYVLLSCLLLFVVELKTDVFHIANLMLLCFYCFHNYFRNRIKYLTDFFLNISKYLIPILVFSPLGNHVLLGLLLFSFPFMRTIFYILVKENINHVDIYQCAMFFVVTSVAYCLTKTHGIPVEICFLFLFFFLYRCIIVIKRLK